MARELKVYGWIGWRNEAKLAPNGSHQTREIVAAHSVAEVLRIAGITRSEYGYSGSETGNDEELAVALAEPGVVFWAALDASNRPGTEWRAAR